MTSKTVLIKNVRPFANGSWQKEQDIFLENGVWGSAGVRLRSPPDMEIDGSGLLALPALFAIGADFQEPVRDDVYSFANGIEAMQRGGFHGCLYESKANPIDDLQQLASFKQLCKNSNFNISLLASFSRANEHKNISEMLELASSGAAGFGDGGVPVWNLRFLRMVFEYGKATGKTFYFHPMQPDLYNSGVVNEGLYSDTIGFKGIPEQAETIAVYQILEFSRWFGVPVHLREISCKKSIELIARAKDAGVNVSCDVGIYHLLFDDSSILTLSSEYRFSSPLRSAEDKEALWKGLLDGTARYISCNHYPVRKQEKQTNFEDASPGAVSLEIALSALWGITAEKTSGHPERLLEWMGAGVLEQGAHANLILFNPNFEWEVSENAFAGSVCNSPLLGKKLKGKISHTYLNAFSQLPFFL
jgi:dihydroorotase